MDPWHGIPEDDIEYEYFLENGCGCCPYYMAVGEEYAISDYWNAYYSPSNFQDQWLARDLRSVSTRARRNTNKLAKYGLKKTWRHIHPRYNLSPESQEQHQLGTLLHTQYPSRGRMNPPKGHWKIPPTQQVQYYGISNKTVKAHPTGNWKRKFRKDCRYESKLQRCRDSLCCFRHKVEKTSRKGKRAVKREGWEAGLEWRNGEVERWEDDEKMRAELEEEWQGEQGKEDQIDERTRKKEKRMVRRNCMPCGCSDSENSWGEDVDEEAAEEHDRRLQSLRPGWRMFIIAGYGGREDEIIVYKVDTTRNWVAGVSGVEDGGDESEWAFVDLDEAGLLSDGESWQADFESAFDTSSASSTSE
ncbi:hypothetical protein BJ508DRAFT_339945 [Ascobolus immersus RN42]|uniref:Uncharacterized protein n=1 Tax=Ascobolus immersus RN42 TaxID=1160509 RepID=A0A3N4IG56_ASCIM|nr:hypothetical protein BJ508DRAFT_339945 [Ascobolus immersus RN42]